MYQLIQQQGQILTLLTSMINQNTEQQLQAPLLPTQSAFGQLLLPPHPLRPTLPSVGLAMSQSKVTTPQLNSHLMLGQNAVNNSPQTTFPLLGQQVVHPAQHAMLPSLGQQAVSPSLQATLPSFGQHVMLPSFSHQANTPALGQQAANSSAQSNVLLSVGKQSTYQHNQTLLLLCNKHRSVSKRSTTQHNQRLLLDTK